MSSLLSFNDRVLGAIWGAMLGDALGSQYSFMKAESLAQIYPKHAYNLSHISDETQSMVALLEALCNNGVDFDAIGRSYVRWAMSNPADIDVVSHSAFTEHNAQCAQDLWQKNGQNFGRLCSNLLLTRQIPWAIAGVRWDLLTLRHCIELDTKLSHDPSVCAQEAQLFSIALSSILKGQDKHCIWKHLFAHSSTKDCYRALLDSYFKAPRCDGRDYSDILITLQAALYYFWHAENFVSAIRCIIARGGACDTNASACGALLGAHFGAKSIPRAWVQSLMQNPENTQGRYSANKALSLTHELLALQPEPALERIAA